MQALKILIAVKQYLTLNISVILFPSLKKTFAN